MEQTFIILKPSAISRNLIGEVIQRFEKKGMQLCALKMTQLDDTILNEHYAHLAEKKFFQRIKNAMMKTPVVVSVWKGVGVVDVARQMAGTTNGRNALPGTIRGDYSMSIQENIVHTSDSVENAKIEIARFFNSNEIYEYESICQSVLYANDEV